MKRDVLYKMYCRGVVVDMWIVPFQRFYRIEYLLNNGDKGSLEAFAKKSGIRKFRSIDAACSALFEMGVDPVRVCYSDKMIVGGL